MATSPLQQFDLAQLVNMFESFHKHEMFARMNEYCVKCILLCVCVHKIIYVIFIKQWRALHHLTTVHCTVSNGIYNQTNFLHNQKCHQLTWLALSFTFLSHSLSLSLSLAFFCIRTQWSLCAYITYIFMCIACTFKYLFFHITKNGFVHSYAYLDTHTHIRTYTCRKKESQLTV